MARAGTVGAANLSRGRRAVNHRRTITYVVIELVLGSGFARLMTLKVAILIATPLDLLAPSFLVVSACIDCVTSYCILRLEAINWNYPALAWTSWPFCQ